jgi:hypothetical protein
LAWYLKGRIGKKQFLFRRLFRRHLKGRATGLPPADAGFCARQSLRGWRVSAQTASKNALDIAAGIGKVAATFL